LGASLADCSRARVQARVLSKMNMPARPENEIDTNCTVEFDQ
jgi:hypothetical protein